MRRMNTLGALLLGGALALAGCSGSDGSAGAPGKDGTNGNNGTNGANGATGQKLKLVIDGVTTANNVATLTFTVYPAANVCPGGTCDDKLKILGQKTFYAQEYNPTTNTFDTAKNFSFPTSLSATANPPSTVHFKALTADGNGAQYTVTAANPPFTVETSASAFVYGYIATPGAVPAPSTGHYSLPSSVSSASKVYGTIAYSSAANVAGCEKCHNKPYSKHGYRQATVAGLPDFASCKVCHTDQRHGEDGQWYVFADDPAAYDPDVWDTVKYAYTANIMNDVHNSHAMEFNYPQFMANCVTCHAGKLNRILDDSCFRPSVCKSCHPVTGPAAGTQEGRAPALLSVIPHSVGNLYSAAETACTGCHVTGNTVSAPLLKDFHPGFNTQAYKDATLARFDASIASTCVSATYDGASYVATITFSVSGVSSTTASINPTVVGGLYGYDTKDFIVSGHGTAADGKRNLEWANGSTRNSARLVVTQDANDRTRWTAVANLSAWASMLDSGQVKRMEVAFMPEIGVNPNAAVSATNLAAAVGGYAQTVNLKPASATADARVPANKSYGKQIVDPKKCQNCHDALGTYWWHAPKNGSAGVVGCRLCHAVTNAAGYYEMQSRSIDSFLHGAHQMEMAEIAKNYDPTNAVSNIRYEKWVEGNFPNFAGPLNCEACHYAGTYNPPDQGKSLPGLISGVTNLTTRTGLPIIGQQVVGPAARACGGCHRAQAINELDGTKLAAFIAHTSDFGSAVFDATALVSTAAYVEYMIGGSTTSIAAPTGAQVEQCMICHPTAGSDHQNLFNIWANGIKQ